MANKVFIATSLDGFIAKKDGDIDWLHEIPNPTGSDYGYAEFMNGVDALVMGRNTFEKVLTFGQWPYDKMVFVLSTSLKKIDSDLDGKAEIIQGKPMEITTTLATRGFKNLYIDGGKTIQSFLSKGLIDEITISQIPIVLGDGIPLFGHQDRSFKFEHCSTEVLDGGMVKSCYRKTNGRD